MTTEEKAAAFDTLVMALVNYWHDGTYSANCTSLVAQPAHDTPEACVPDLMRWAERNAAVQVKKRPKPTTEPKGVPVETPEAIKPYAPEYKPDAWMQYTVEDLDQWYRLLTKRAGMRNTEQAEKIAKDLADAENYRQMRDAMAVGGAPA